MKLLAILCILLLFIGLPALVAWDMYRNRGQRASDRPIHTSAAAAFLGALDRVVRPSVEHQIEEENRVVKEDEDVGGEV